MKIKVLTLNIWEGRFLKRIIEFLKTENPDIVLLQEVFDGKEEYEDLKYKSFDLLKQNINLSYSVFEPSFIDTRGFGRIPQGNAVFSRFPIENNRIIFFDIPFGEFNIEESDQEANIDKRQYIPMTMLRADIKLDNNILYAYSIHGIWGFDGYDSKRRLEMGDTIVNEIKDKENVILGGDFNLNPNTKTIGNIEKYLQSVFKNELTSTFNMKHKKLKGYARASVDMIFVSKKIKIIKHYMPEVDVSDHMPLVCEVEI